MFKSVTRKNYQRLLGLLLAYKAGKACSFKTDFFATTGFGLPANFLPAFGFLLSDLSDLSDLSGLTKSETVMSTSK